MDEIVFVTHSFEIIIPYRFSFSFPRSAGHQGRLTRVTLRGHTHKYTIRPHWLHFKVCASLRRAVSASESSVVWRGALEQWLVDKQRQPRIKSRRETGSRAASHTLSITSHQRWHEILRSLSTSLKISTSNFLVREKKKKESRSPLAAVWQQIPEWRKTVKCFLSFFF